MALNKQLIASLWQLTNPRHKTKRRRRHAEQREEERVGENVGINCFDGGCHRRQQHRQNPSEEGHRHSSSSLFQVQGMFLFSQFHFFFSHFHMPMICFPFKVSPSNITIPFQARACVFLWCGCTLTPKLTIWAFFFGMMKLCACTSLCMNVGFWVEDILLKIPFFIEERVTRKKSLFD